MYRFKIDVEDFTSILNIYIGTKRLTQEEFGCMLLTNRQAIASLTRTPIEELSDVMLLRLYYYFSEQVDNGNQDIEKVLLNIIKSEMSKRTYDNLEQKGFIVPKKTGRTRKKK